jgi:hypothetical protein
MKLLLLGLSVAGADFSQSIAFLQPFLLFLKALITA